MATTKTTIKKTPLAKAKSLDDIKGDRYKLYGVVCISNDTEHTDKLLALGYKKVEETTPPPPPEPEPEQPPVE